MANRSLPDLGSDVRAIMSPKNEVILGDAWLAKLRSTGKISTDLIVNAYLNNLGKKLIIYAGVKSYPVKFFGVAEDSFNAFAFFGGNIGIHEGLIKYTNNENELAAVMAHEIAHIAQEHMLRQVAQQRQLLPITMAEALAAIAVGNPDLIMAVLAGHGQQVINFTRDHEKEADRLGIQILAKAGFDPQAMPTLFQQMSQHSRYDTRPPEYLLTHPVYESRIADARHRAESFQYKQNSSSLNYYLIKARVYALSPKNSQEKIAYFQQQLATQRYEHADACAYGYALALLVNNEAQKAVEILQKLVIKQPNSIIIQLALIEAEIQTNAINLAMAQLERLYKLFPDDLALNLVYAEQLLSQKKASLAKKVLLNLKEKYPVEPLVYTNLSRIEGALGNMWSMHTANCEWYLLHADYGSALIQLEMAAAVAQDSIQKNLVKQRQKQIEELLMQQKSI